jgi:hypothetical protein
MGFMEDGSDEVISPKLTLVIIVGLFGTVAIVDARAAHDDDCRKRGIPCLWEKEFALRGSLHPKDLGMSSFPTQPGKYKWEGQRVTSIDCFGEVEVYFKGHWTNISTKV